MRAPLVAFTCALGLMGLGESASALAPTEIDAAPAVDCVSGFHAERGGGCRADIARIDRYCPVGTAYEPLVDGFTCARVPAAAY